MLEGFKQHMPRVRILTLGSLNYIIHFEEHGSNDKKKIEYGSGNERH